MSPEELRQQVARTIEDAWLHDETVRYNALSAADSIIAEVWPAIRRALAIAAAAEEWAEGWAPHAPDPVQHGTNLVRLYDLALCAPVSSRPKATQ